MSTRSDQDEGRFRLRLEMAGEERVRNNLEQGMYGAVDSTHASIASEFLERLREDREATLGPRALEGPAQAIKHSKEFGPSRALKRSVDRGSPRSSRWSWWRAVAVGVMTLAFLAIASVMGWL